MYSLQLFIAKVRGGSSVKFSWMIDSLEQFAHEGESYSVMFNTPAEYKLKVRFHHLISFFHGVNHLHIAGNSLEPCELPEPADPPNYRPLQPIG